MAVRPQHARSLALTATSLAIAISLAVTGTATRAGMATAQTVPTTLVNVQTHAPSGWVTTTDPTSGISVMLPGQPTVQNSTTPAADGTPLPLHQYTVELNGGSRAVLFQVVDGPFRSIDFDKSLQGVASGYSNGKVTDSRHFTLAGRPADDGRITATVEGTSAVFLIRLVADNGYLVMILTLGRDTEEAALATLHQQVLETLRLI